MSDWRDEAACRDRDNSLWYPPVIYSDAAEERPRRETAKLYREARRICNTCPVKGACLEYALVNHEHYGMWGGLTRSERATLARQRRQETTA